MKCVIFVSLFLVAFLASFAEATITAYTDQASFEAQLSATASVNLGGLVTIGQELEDTVTGVAIEAGGLIPSLLCPSLVLAATLAGDLEVALPAGTLAVGVNIGAVAQIGCSAVTKPITYAFTSTNGDALPTPNPISAGFFGLISDDPTDTLGGITFSAAGSLASLGSVITGNTLAPGSVGGDPHFVGLKGEKYDVLGEANKWFNLITTPQFQFNAFFHEACKGKNWITSISSVAIKINKHVFLLNNTGDANIDAVSVPLSNTPTNIGLDGSIVSPKVNHFTIKTNDFNIMLERFVVDQSAVQPGWAFYGTDCLVAYFNIKVSLANEALHPHGLLGQTAHHSHSPNKSFAGTEGEGEIEGTYRDYIVSGPLADDFKFNQYAL